METTRCARCGVELTGGEQLCPRCLARAREAGAAAEAPQAQSVALPPWSRLDPSAGLVVAGGNARGAGHLTAAREWCRGRNPWVRIPLLAWFAYILLRHLRDADYESLFGGLNLVVHEAGHLVFGWFGEMPGVAGGTILQLAAPVIAAIVFWRQRDRFAMAVTACWLSTNLFNVARYAGDARAQILPLVSPTSGDPIHDWHFMLGRIGMLKWDTVIAADIRRLAVLSMLAGLGAGAWLVWQMLRPRGESVA